MHFRIIVGCIARTAFRSIWMGCKALYFANCVQKSPRCFSLLKWEMIQERFLTTVSLHCMWTAILIYISYLFCLFWDQGLSALVYSGCSQWRQVNLAIEENSPCRVTKIQHLLLCTQGSKEPVLLSGEKWAFHVRVWIFYVETTLMKQKKTCLCKDVHCCQ